MMPGQPSSKSYLFFGGVYSVRQLFHPLFPIRCTLCLQRHVQTHVCRFGVESHLPIFSLFHEHDVLCTHHEHRRTTFAGTGICRHCFVLTTATILNRYNPIRCNAHMNKTRLHFPCDTDLNSDCIRRRVLSRTGIYLLSTVFKFSLSYNPFL